MTPIEIIIGVVLLAVLSGVVVFQAFRFIAKADDSAASRSLEAAVTVVEVMGQLDASRGGGNLVGDPNPSTEIAITKLNEQLTGAKLATVEKFGIKILDPHSSDRSAFNDLVGDAQSLWVNAPKKSAIPIGSITNPYATDPVGPGHAVNQVKLWSVRNPNLGTPDANHAYRVGTSFVEAEYPEIPDGDGHLYRVYGLRVRDGNLVRLGLKSVSGATFCAISVKDGSVIVAKKHSDVTGYETTDKSQLVAVHGVGYQSVDAEATSYTSSNRPGADCGAFALKSLRTPTHTLYAGRYNDHWINYFIAELPGLPGTDTRLMSPGPDSYGL